MSQGFGGELELRPSACPGLATAVAAVHLGVATVPWAAGCSAWLAALLSGASLVLLPSALRAVPGPWASIRDLRVAARGWRVTLADGSEQEAIPAPSSRVFARWVACRVYAAGRGFDWWLPGYAFSEGDFRRLKVALRCGHGAAAP